MSTITSWVPIPANSDFSIHNLPWGIFSTPTLSPRVGVAIGEQVIDVYAVAELGLLTEFKLNKEVFLSEFLNELISLGKPITSGIRLKLQQLLSEENSPLKDQPGVFHSQADVKLHLPVKIGDYTDFYSSLEHATNVGKMFRDPENALLPNWKYLPVGYHGRASSIIVSGVDIHRPKGQTKPTDGPPIYDPSQSMDFELEMGFIIGKETKLGHSLSTAEAEDYIFGMVLFNDWSARDIQKWEYVPLGPFLGKNFASSISPWIVPLEALEQARVDGPVQDPKVLPYLTYEGQQNYDIALSVSLQAENREENIICKSNFKYMYWNMVQQLAHHTVNGCNVNVGDLMASGTISGKTADSYGSMLELSWSGKKPIILTDGSKRTFLEDYDTIIIRGHAGEGKNRVGFGEIRTKLLPSL
ncbi:MAG: fumarylacetoacetase [Bacteroidota bacterium]